MGATAEEIKLAIIKHQQNETLSTEVLIDIARHLLITEARATYDAQLKAGWKQSSQAKRAESVNVGATEQSNLAVELPELASQKTLNEQALALKQQQEWYQTMVGEAKADYYLEQFYRLEHGQRARFNWAVFWIGSVWFFARGMWKHGLAVAATLFFTLFTAGVMGVILGPWGAFAIVSIWLVWRLVYLPAMANQRYWRFARKKIEQYQLKYQWQGAKMDKALVGLSNVKVIYTIYFLILAYIVASVVIMGGIYKTQYDKLLEKKVQQQAFRYFSLNHQQMNKRPVNSYRPLLIT